MSDKTGMKQRRQSACTARSLRRAAPLVARRWGGSAWRMWIRLGLSYLALSGVLVACASAPESPARSTPDAIAIQLSAAEAVVDAFYSFEPQRLEAALAGVDGKSTALYYQGWAEGGNYRVQTRRPCAAVDQARIECAITVTDDIGAALGYVATDTFIISTGRAEPVGTPVLTAIDFSSDDPPVFQAVFEWLNAERPEVFTGPCKDLFVGGTTPGACVREVVRGARDYMAREAAR